MRLSWPAVLAVAVLAGAGLGALQPRDEPAADPSPTAQAAAPAPRAVAQPGRREAARVPVTRVPATPTPSVVADGRWPGGVRTMLSSSGQAHLALTFEGALDPDVTRRLLDVLGRHDVPATFCLVGDQVRGYETLVRRMHADGHTLCNHTAGYDYALPVRSPAEIAAQVARATRQIQRAEPEASITVFRAPADRFTPEVVEVAAAAGLTAWGWSVDGREWRDGRPASIVAAVLDDVQPGSVVALSQTTATVAAVETLVPVLQSVGYEFVGLS